MATRPDKPDKQDNRNHPEAWAPPLLRALIERGPDSLTEREKTWAVWSKDKFNTGALQGDGSWNHQHMIAAALTWLGDGAAAEWLLNILEINLGKVKDAPEILRRFGGNETLSSTYEPFRAGSYNAIRLLALRHPGNPLADRAIALTSRYNEVLAALLSLGAVPWTDAKKFKGSAGAWYNGPMVSPVGERSGTHAFQGDLGPFLGLACGLSFVSKREDWPLRVCRLCPGGLGIPPASVQKISDVLQGTTGPEPVLDLLSGITLWSPTNWSRWSDGTVLTYKDARQNGNTACIFWSLADPAAQQMSIGYPWPAGFSESRHASGTGECRIEGRQIVARVGGLSAERDLSEGPPLWSVRGDSEGVRVVGHGNPGDRDRPTDQ